MRRTTAGVARAFVMSGVLNALAACGPEAILPPPPPPAFETVDCQAVESEPAVEILMKAITFEPVTATVPAGGLVRWRNVDLLAHTATRLAPEGVTFDTGNVDPGEDACLRVRAVGDHDYDCSYHPGMRGTLRVAP